MSSTTDVAVAGASNSPSNPWPVGARFGSRGLEIRGLAASDLADRFGTPLIVVDEEDLRARCRAFHQAFANVLYAVKAFTCRRVIAIVVEEGLRLLAATGGELTACLRAGADPGRIALHGNNKSDDELELAAHAGIGLVICDNNDEVRRLSEIADGAGRTQPVLVRVAPGVSAGTHTYIDTGALDSKFGTPLSDGQALNAVRAVVSSPRLVFRGLHVHVGSQILRMDPYLEVLDLVLEFSETVRDEMGAAVDVLDVGGGFGVTYTDETPIPVGELAASLRANLQARASSREIPVPDLMVEPGRAVVANTALTLYRVGSVKRVPGVRTFVAVDGGMADNIRPALYGARYTVALAGPPRPGVTERMTVVGRHCESGDVVAEEVPLPAGTARGDLLAVAATGAYCYSMASNYNRATRPAVVGVTPAGPQFWLRRETDDDLDRLEVEGVPRGRGAEDAP